MLRNEILTYCLTGALVASFAFSSSAQSVPIAAAVADAKAVPKQRIWALIQQLGAPQYRARERAEAQLEALGLLAFEALLEHRDYEDIEIRLRARRLVAKLRSRFLSEGVDPALHRYVSSYAQRNEEGRELTITLLADYLPQQSVNELSRIARFEEINRISKQAALAIMSVPYPNSREQRQKLAARLQTAVGYGDRVAVQWLRLYAAALAGEKYQNQVPSDVWQIMMADDQALQQQERPGETTPTIVSLMHRLLGDLQDIQGDLDAATESRAQYSRAGFTDAGQVEDWADWLLQREAWSAVVQLGSVQQAFVQRNATLAYAVAEAHRRLGSDQPVVDDAIATAQQALSKGDDTERLILAARLEDERGLFDWSESEYRQLLENTGPDSLVRIEAAYRLSEMLHGEQRGKAAYDVIQTMFARAEEDAQVQELIDQRWDNESHRLKARMQLYLACHHRDQGEYENERECLEKGIELDATEADILIAMYRSQDASDEWKNQTLRAIRDAAENFRRQIYDHRRDSEGTESGVDDRRLLASALNQFAWLVSNTEGDYTEALRMSKKSLEFSPGEAGIMDTLGRCYYAVGDFENAVKYQRWAAERSPHEGPIIRQLELFESALANQ